MGLPGHRRTSSHKRRRASHFALGLPTLSSDAAGNTHLGHRAGPQATEYRGHTIHRKGLQRKLEKLLAKTKPHDHDHDHEPAQPPAA